jgi:hypothetical protein
MPHASSPHLSFPSLVPISSDHRPHSRPSYRAWSPLLLAPRPDLETLPCCAVSAMPGTISGAPALPLFLALAHGAIYVLVVSTICAFLTASRCDYDLRTPLHMAVAAGQLEATRLLLATGVAVNHEDVYGRTALHDAAIAGRAEVPRCAIVAYNR